MSSSLMSNRPFADSLAVQPKLHTNCNVLCAPNCAKLEKTIPNIMPYDTGANYKMQYHKVPQYLNSACLPFSQEYYSLGSFDHLRYSSFEQG